MTKFLILFGGILFCGPVFSQQPGNVPSSIDPNHLTVEEDDSPALIFSFRLNAYSPVKQIEAKTKDIRLAVSHKAFGENPTDTTAYLFMVDTSNTSTRRTAVHAMRDRVKMFLSEQREGRKFAVYTFSTKLKKIVDFDDPKETYEAKMNSIQPDGNTTQLFNFTVDAIDILKGIDAKRKAIVLLSDGQAEDPLITVETIEKLAKEAGIFIHGISFPANEPSSRFDQSLKMLARGSNGVFERLDYAKGWPMTTEMRDRFIGHIESGSTANIDLKGVNNGDEITITITLENGNTINHTHTKGNTPVVTRDPAAPGNPTVPAPGVDAATTPQPPPKEWLKRQWLIPAILGVLLVAFLVLMRIITKKDEPAPIIFDPAESPSLPEWMKDEAAITGGIDRESETTRLVSPGGNNGRPGGTVYAQLKILDGGPPGETFYVTETAVKIGRGSDNDIILANNNSVSRNHASIIRKRDGSFVIKELIASNGVVLNGKSVENSVLRHNDIIELGEVKLHFHVV